MIIFAEIKGQKAIKAALERSGNAIYAAAVEQLKESVLAIHSNAIRLIQENNDGKAQIRHNPFRVVRVSAEGDPPNTDRGGLVRSIKFDFTIGKFGGKLTGAVGTNLKYGAWLEFGTLKMGARPWLSRAIEFESRNIQADFSTKIKDSLKAVTS